VTATHLGLVDAASAAVLGIPEYLDRLAPDGAPGKAELSNLQTYDPNDHEAWRTEIRALQAVESWVEAAPDAHRDLRDALAELPELDVPLRRLASDTALGDGDLFDLKRFGYYGSRALQYAGVLLDDLDPPDDGSRRLKGLVHRIHPGGEQTPRFHLSGELDAEFERRLDRRRQLADELEALRDSIGDEVVDQLGGSCGLRGRYRPDEEAETRELEAHPHVERESDGWRLTSEHLRELEDDLAEAREALTEAERRVREELTQALAKHTHWLAEMADFLARLDVRLAKVRLKDEIDGCWGEWSDDADAALAFREGREPRIEARVAADGGSIQPVEFALEPIPSVVTGPNMGGKSALLALAGLCQWCAQHACPVPASELTFRPVSSIVYVGSEEPSAVAASRGLSSFGREVRRLVDALESEDRPVLWLLDEIGRGTHPDDGASLAEDLLERLADRGDRTLAATHFPALADADRFPTFRIRGLEAADDLEQALGDAETLDAVERVLREAMDFQPAPADDGAIPRDARRVARALGLELDG